MPICQKNKQIHRERTATGISKSTGSIQEPYRVSGHAVPAMAFGVIEPVVGAPYKFIASDTEDSIRKTAILPQQTADMTEYIV